FGLACAREDCCNLGPQVWLLWQPGRATDKAHGPPAETAPNAKSRPRHLDWGRAGPGRLQGCLLAFPHDPAAHVCAFWCLRQCLRHGPVAQALRLQLSASGCRLGSSRCKPAARVAYHNVATDAAQGASPESPAVVWRCSQLPAVGHAHVDVGAAWAATDGPNIGPAERL